MFQTNFKLSIRSLMKNKLYSFINILGLTIGMTSTILIFSWIHNEISHDRFFTKADRIYLMNNRDMYNGELFAWNYTPKPMGLAIKKDYPEVEDVVRVDNSGANFLLSNGDKHFSLHGNFADVGFLQMFSFPLLAGHASNALSSVSNIVLTEQLAKKLFGNQDAMGKTVKIDSANFLTVTAVLKDLPSNTSFDFEYLLPWSYATKVGLDDNYWGNNSIQTFVLLKQGVSSDAFNRKVSNITIEHLKKDETTTHVFAQPYKDAWLYSKVENGQYVGGRIDQVRLFIIIAIFILLIACINFTNLSTARSEKRAKEVGMRKVAGARKRSLIMQFISESVLLSFAAGIFAIAVAQLCLPLFSGIVGKKILIDYSNSVYWMCALLFILITGFAAGIYPAFYLSSFQPVKVLKGTFQPVNNLVTPRKVLVVLQFSFAIALIICTIIVKDQIVFAQNRDAGYSRNNLAFVIMFGDAKKNRELIKKDLLSSGAATAVSLTSAPITEHWSDSNGFSWTGSEQQDKDMNFIMYSADDSFSKTMGLTLLSGRDIDDARYKTDSTAVLVNEKAVKMMGMKHPLGQIITGQGNTLHVIGVVKDFILESPYYPVKPMFIAGPSFGYSVINFRLNPNPSISESLAKAEAVFKRYNPQYPFNCRFYDSEYGKKFEDERRAGTLAGLFAGLTIFISCLGLFGLATYMAENRTKEIGIRKVLGASVASITGMLSKDFLKLVAISFVIASPLAWLLMNRWLLNYEYRIAIQWYVFAVAGLLSFLIAIATVSFQSIKAGLQNPVKSLRSE
ncbi:MAG: FtsX-like permease family protein [Sphingobacteriaceae bacterium]|nr:MAG: FtsX-like permease family protein [Sphingobacteriaceae bacterium]